VGVSSSEVAAFESMLVLTWNPCKDDLPYYSGAEKSPRADNNDAVPGEPLLIPSTASTYLSTPKFITKIRFPVGLSAGAVVLGLCLKMLVPVAWPKTEVTGFTPSEAASPAAITAA